MMELNSGNSKQDQIDAQAFAFRTAFMERERPGPACSIWWFATILFGGLVFWGIAEVIWFLIQLF